MMEASLKRRRLEEAADWWAKMQDEETLPGDVSQWLDWLEADPDNREAFQKIQELSLRLEATVPRRRSFLTPSPLWGEGWGEGFPRKLAAAAAIVVVLAGALIWARMTASPSSPATLVLSTPVAALEQSPLPDGSRVSLGGATSLEAVYTPASRELRLKEGEAYFEVRPERGSRPFVVSAGLVSIRALGTAFNVRKTHERVAVTVTEGKVQVARSDAAGAGVEVVAGEQAVYDPATNRFRVAAIDAPRALSWRERRLEFTDEPLDSVIANVNRYSGRRIEARGVDLHAHSYTGTFNPDTLDDWLVAIERAFPVRIERRGDGVLIEPRE